MTYKRSNKQRILILLVTIYSTSALGRELVVNGGFETGWLDGWTAIGEESDYDVINSVMPSHPITNHITTEYPITVVSGDAHTGTYSAYLSRGSLSQTLQTTPGTTYKLTFWLEGKDYEKFVVSIVVDNKILIKILSQETRDDLENMKYEKYSLRFTAKRKSTVIKYKFDVYSEPPLGIGLDDISVVENKPILDSARQNRSAR